VATVADEAIAAAECLQGHSYAPLGVIAAQVPTACNRCGHIAGEEPCGHRHGRYYGCTDIECRYGVADDANNTIEAANPTEATLLVGNPDFSDAFVAGGSYNTVSGPHSAVLAGTDNLCSGERAVIIGGTGVILRADDSAAIACTDIEIDGAPGQVWAGNARVLEGDPGVAEQLRAAIHDSLRGIHAGLCPTCYRAHGCAWHMGGECGYVGRGLPPAARHRLRKRLDTWHPVEAPGPKDEAAFLVAVDKTLEGMSPEMAEAAGRVIEEMRAVRLALANLERLIEVEVPVGGLGVMTVNASTVVGTRDTPTASANAQQFAIRHISFVENSVLVVMPAWLLDRKAADGREGEDDDREA